MNFLTFLCVVSVAMSFASAGPPSQSFAQEYVIHQMKKFNLTEKSKVDLYGFSFNDCSAADDPLKGNLYLSPNDPVTLPGELIVSFNATFGVTLDSPLKLVLDIQQKWWFGWVKIPCLFGAGSCTYDDVCSMIPPTPPSGCPQPLKDANIPCACPFRKGKYIMKPTVIDVKSIPSGIPSWLVNGEVYVKVNFYDGSTELSCAEIYFELKLNN